MSRKQKMAGTAGTVALLVVVLAIGVVSSSGTGQEPCVRVATTTTFSDVDPDKYQMSTRYHISFISD